MGNSEDSIFKTPMVTDSGNTYVASFTINTNSGADILIIKYNDEGQPVWTQTWSGPGNGRDQASGIIVDDENVYVTGTTFTSIANNFDYITLKLTKTGGVINWAKTFNGSASNYDVATAITAIGKYVFVTGLANNLNTSTDYTTIKYLKSNGDELWSKNFDRYGLMEIPFGISVVGNDTVVAITGASQHTVTDWDYATMFYFKDGIEKDTNIVSGTSAGFDRAHAVKSDAFGNIYITGTISQSITGFDIKTVKIDPAGNVDWQVTYDNDSSADEGIDLIVDADLNVYVCGKSHDTVTDFDYLIRKYNSSGVVKWTKRVDLSGDTDEPQKMCFDAFGNIIITGKGISQESESYDLLTAAFDTSGIEIWRQTYGVTFKEDDQAQDLAADENGNIYVTGEVILEENGSPQTVTIKYRSDYYTDPQQIDTPAVANYFYTNYGQIADENGNATDPEKLHYYTIHHYPQLYFQEGMMSMVFSHIDADTSTEDTLQRVDVSFWHGEPSMAFPVNEKETAGYYNYFLAHCPEGITNVQGNEKLLFEDVYEGIDALYSSNNAGLKLYFICDGNSNPSQIGLFFEGQNDLQIISNWGLQVETAVGNYEFEKPRVYRIDGNGNVRNTNWQLSWDIPNPGEARIIGWGEWGSDETLVIEISKTNIVNTLGNTPSWSTYLGGSLDDISTSVCTNSLGYPCITGHSFSSVFINQIGIFNPTQGSNNGQTDVFLASFTDQGDLIWWTYYGGVDFDRAWDICYDKEGAAERLYVVGSTKQPDPSIQLSTANIDCYQQEILAGVQGLIIEVNSINGSPIWVSTIGGEYTFLHACDIENNHNVVIVGNDLSYDYPGSTDCHPQHPPSAGTERARFPLCNTATGVYSQYNPSRHAMCDPNAPIPPNNENGIIARFTNEGVLNYSTFFGGIGDDYMEDVAIDQNGNIFIVGGTYSDAATACTTYCAANQDCDCEGTFPLCKNTGNLNTYFSSQRNINGAQQNVDGFILKLDNNLSIEWSTYYGSGQKDFCTGVACNSNGDVYVTGWTNCRIASSSCGVPTSTNTFPICHNNGAYQQVAYGGVTTDDLDNFISRFSNDGVLKWSSFLGGYGSEGINPKVAIDLRDNVYVVGSSNSPQQLLHSEFITQSYGTLYFQQSNKDATWTTPNVSDGYIACFSEAWDKEIWATYFGGLGVDISYNVAASQAFLNQGFLYVVGETSAASYFPVNIPFANHQCCSETSIGGIDGFLAEFYVGNLINIDENENKMVQMKSYPSPAKDYLNIEFKSSIKTKCIVSIYNTIGNLCVEETMDVYPGINRSLISIGNLKNGIYFIEVSGKENLRVSKFIKNE